MTRIIAAIAIAIAAPASADERGYAHVHQAAPQRTVDPATAAAIGLAVELLEEIVRQRRAEEKKRCYDSHGYYIC